MFKIILTLFKMPIWEVVLVVVIVGILFKVVINLLWMIIKKIFRF